MFRETGIVVARIACDFLAEPVGTRERLILCAKLHLGNDEPFIRAMKDIDLPYMAVSCELDMADFLDDAQLTEREHGTGVSCGDLVLKLRPPCCVR